MLHLVQVLHSLQSLLELLAVQLDQWLQEIQLSQGFLVILMLRLNQGHLVLHCFLVNLQVRDFQQDPEDLPGQLLQVFQTLQPDQGIQVPLKDRVVLDSREVRSLRIDPGHLEVPEVLVVLELLADQCFPEDPTVLVDRKSLECHQVPSLQANPADRGSLTDQLVPEVLLHQVCLVFQRLQAGLTLLLLLQVQWLLEVLVILPVLSDPRVL